MTGIAIYTRISLDDGTALGVARQEADCRKLAELRGFEVEAVYQDNDVSAYKRNVTRTRFEQLLTDLAEGKVSGVVVYDLDRFARQPRDLERAIDLFEGSTLKFATVAADIDLGSADGRTMARVMVAFANKSSADTGRRVARKHLESAMLGKPVGGTRPFGWLDDKVTIEPTEAEAIRTGVRSLLRGESLHSVVRRWNEAGLTTSKGNAWNTSTARQMLRSPRLAGFRVHQDKMLFGEDGAPVRGQWAPILDVQTWELLQARFEASKATNTRPGKRSYLLSGLIRCGACGTVLRHNAQVSKGTRYYACPSPSQGGCGKVGVSAPKVEQIVEEEFLARWSGFQIQRDRAVWPKETELAQGQERLSELMASFTSGQLSASVVFPAVEALEAELAALRAEQRAFDAEHHGPIAHGPASRWDVREVSDKRTTLEALLQGIVVEPAKGRGGAFDPSRVHVAWKSFPKAEAA